MRLASLVAVLTLAAACGAPPTVPTPPAPLPALAITCPSNVTAVAANGGLVPVSWAAPVPSGGRAPVQIVCTLLSGSVFPTGASPVMCTASDAAGQQAACSFTVTVTPAPKLSVTRLVAFGDSITWGKDAPAAPFTAFPEPPPPTSYPTQLASMLSSTYPSQGVAVINEGWPGEPTMDGLDRLPGVLAVHQPDVLLLLHGANDLLGDPSRTTTERIAARLRDMVRTAESRVAGIRVMLATFPPQYHGTVPYDRGAGADFVPELNERIAAVAASEGVVLVDLHAAMAGDVKGNIGQDGLHPTVRGFTVMAETFASAIQRTFPAPAAGLR